MSTPPPAGSPLPRSDRRFGLSRRVLLLVAAAFGLGLLLFGLLWLDKRNDNDFFRADAPPPSQAGQEFEPLPTPLPGGRGTGAGSEDDARGIVRDGNGGTLPESTVPEGGVIEEAPLPPEQPPPPPPPIASGGATSAQPIHSPRPRFPPRALQRGESGSILLQVQVDAQGNPAEVDVVQSSRSRDLDREAVRAVRQWRFRPATRDGAPISSKVLIPIDFSPGR